MEHIGVTAERIITLLPGSTHPLMGVSENIKYFAIDLCKICKNIRETSFSEADRLARIDVLSRQAGIDYLILKDLC